MNELLCNTIPDIFSFKSNIPIKARIVHIYDGDTIHIIFNYKNEIIKIVSRLYGIDTAEMTDHIHKELAYKARNRLIQLATNVNINLDDTMSSRSNEFINKINQNTKIIDVILMDQDKYGRTLVKLYVDGLYINNELIKENLAKEYFGKTKESF
jgi:endonuclease YncB( thermonuclease family)